jgi:hypothetical protein
MGTAWKIGRRSGNDRAGARNGFGAGLHDPLESGKEKTSFNGGEL